ncbi:glyoxalase/bleomycin resistance protein/dioxygenase [Coccidioides posadasii str. Silveira]|uniref:Glyoxalase/bleomycin resistance protein/dioxygenase n=3 Tax=Coccidioides posadasii TaxID=199306 RepID=E9DI00_COCPS|nr:glyoxalase/bleomycin resistance protein/dioxygenase [Coccidioides posadasii str. Silveira]KMM69551.1 glyoxalase/bleomycin resistance protein/dioxygenase [Coccidioides posadasii RMSCC 3488]
MAFPVFINLSTTKLSAATTFYETMGFIKHPFFSSEHGHAMVHSRNHDIVVMISSADHFQKFIPASRRIPETTIDEVSKNVVLLGLPAKSKQEVDELVERAASAGGKAFPAVKMEGCDESMMYTRAFADLDGYLWEMVWCEEGMVKIADEALSKRIEELEKKSDA